MSIIKRKNEDYLFPSFSTIFDDFFGKDYMKNLKTGTTIPAVNVKEEDKCFKIELAAPGLKKEDFKIDLEHNVLTISSEKKEEKEEKEGKFTKKEYCFHSFSRSFTLPDNVNNEKIEANYADGILNITLHKKENVPSNTRKIDVK